VSNPPTETPAASKTPTDAEQDGSKSLPSADLVTPTLATYFGPTRVSAAAFLKAIRAGKIKRFTDEDTIEASQLSPLNDNDGRRLCALALQPQLPDAVNRWVWVAVQQKLKSEVPNAFGPLEHDAAATFRLIHEQVGTLIQSTEKGQRKHGEILLRLSLAWLISQRSLDLWSALEQLRPIFFRDSSAAVKAARRILTRGKMGEIKDAAGIAGLAQEMVRTAVAQRDDERRGQAQLQAKLEGAQSEIATLQSRIDRIEIERETLSEQLTAAKLQLEQSKQHWGHDMVAIKAQQNVLLRERLAPLLKDALDALEIDPPAPQIALKRLRTALSSIEGADQ
jgi:outer membrane murein-binding lipoprotein Lpp